MKTERAETVGAERRVSTRPDRAPAARPRARVLPDTPPIPTWGQRLLPRTLRTTLAGLGLYTNPVPQPPSIHLQQALAVIHHYGWCKSLDFSPTGKVCIRGAQGLLEKAGHVTPQARDQAVQYMEQVLHAAGIRMQFFAWNDLPGTPQTAITDLLTRASHRARANGD
ncbi:hypothetical protein ACFW9D_05495 [Streptomyces sp. NPDC059524]|uniref:DUF6197 family protein n=1 Tax=Streptomyces sp. NPDC059524 TaxID=3346856 RepID=UPI0036768827